jgi:putative transposase
MMRLMDAHLMNHPTEGVESMVHWLRDQGFPIGPKRIRRLFRIMGHNTIYRRKNLTKAGLREYIRPYLLRGLDILRPNQVWCTDITYIPMRKGFMYLTAVMDVYSRKILAWGISNSMDASWCLEVLKHAIARYGKPAIINSDQGSQYTSALWIQYLESCDIKISMDGKGRATDNTWIERFWKSLKYDYVYLNPSDDGFELFEGVQNHIEYYHSQIHHGTGEKPDVRYNAQLLAA